MIALMKQLNRSAHRVLGLSALILALTGLYLVLHLSTPSDGACMDYGDMPSLWTKDGVVLVPIDPQTSLLRRNDILLAVDGQSMPDLARSMLNTAPARPRFEFGQTVLYTVQRGEQILDIPVKLSTFPLGAQVANKWVNLALLAPMLALAGLVFSRQPNERGAQLFYLSLICLVSLALFRAFLGGIGDMVRVSSFWLERLAEYSTSLLLMGLTLHFALSFPRPYPLIARYRFIVPLIYALPYVLWTAHLFIKWPTTGNALEWFGQWSVAGDSLNMLYLGLTILVLVLNYHAVRGEIVMRQQVRWVVWGYAITLALWLVLALLPKFILGHWLLDRSLAGLLLLPVLICMAIAILRYHLFDIDFYINRALVHGALTVFVIGAYALIVVALSTFFHTQNNLFLSLIATGVITFAFQPVRERVQRGVNRLMYGERDEPYSVLAHLSRRLGETLKPETILPTIVETVARTLKLPYAAIALRQNDHMLVAAEYRDRQTSNGRRDHTGQGNDDAHEFAASPHHLIVPLTYQGEIMGELRLASRTPTESFSPADMRLLNDLARQAGSAVHAVRLTLALQQARAQLVNTREEERRRLRRDLHDGLGPQLASQTLTLDAIARLVRTDPDKAVDYLRSVREQSQQAISDIRNLVYDLRPPALDDLGLSGAVRQLAERLEQPDTPPHITVHVLDDLPPLPAAVEAAAYRIIQEALNNVIKHARATECRVTLCLMDEEQTTLIVEITDNGKGIADNHKSGVGLQSMRERAEELGGRLTYERAPGSGALVIAELPLELEVMHCEYIDSHRR